MHLFPREQKFDPDSQQPISGAYFFGHFDADTKPPFSVSFASFDASFTGEKRHYHTATEKVYIVLQGRGILEVDGKSVVMEPEHMIHVQSGEIHRVQSVVEEPLQFVVVTSEKVNDKIVLDA